MTLALAESSLGDVRAILRRAGCSCESYLMPDYRVARDIVCPHGVEAWTMSFHLRAVESALVAFIASQRHALLR